MPKELAILSISLSQHSKNLRNINLSYNRLNFDEAGEAKVQSERFLTNLEEFFEQSKFVNHVNFSGMNLKRKQIK